MPLLEFINTHDSKTDLNTKGIQTDKELEREQKNNKSETGCQNKQKLEENKLSAVRC